MTWWNKVRWWEVDTPPEQRLYPHLAKALQVPERRVAEMVAEQWCGVRPDDKVPEHLRSLLATLTGVGEDDVPVLEQLAQTLCDKRAAEAEVEQYSYWLFEAYGEIEEPLTLEQVRRLKLPELRALSTAVAMGGASVDEEAGLFLDGVPDPEDE
ncbi:hypothetical protein [Streptomyces sp. WAC 06738]|uniref:hypothetical protein n=1 Tax=Streptomyces sp. WAC 06738 TaxID=2203210 RepID=UPI000F7B2DA0|nr:hypothetical protein [Streptomyces sp. WAC 06738]